MTDHEVNLYVKKIVAAVQDLRVYARANAAIATERASKTPSTLMGGLELPRCRQFSK